MIYQSMSGDADSGTSHFTMTGGSLTSKSGHVFHVTNTNAFITLKDRAVGLVRHEFEYPIPPDDAEAILDVMCGNLVEKNRYRIPAAEPGLAWEVDEYFGANAPLVTAEIELPDEKTVVALPDWIGREVTDDHRYKNNNLAAHPFSEWR